MKKAIKFGGIQMDNGIEKMVQLGNMLAALRFGTKMENVTEKMVLL
jgi:hypothetical protein